MGWKIVFLPPPKKKKAWTISILYLILVILSFMKIRDGFWGFPVSSNLGLLPWGKRKQNSFRESHKMNIAAYGQHVIKKLTVRLKGKMNFNAFHSFLLSWGLANWVALIVNSLDLHLAGQAIPQSQGWGKCRASFGEVWCSAKISVPAGHWQVRPSVSHMEPLTWHLGSRSLELHVLGRSWSSTLSTKLSRENEKTAMERWGVTLRSRF